MKMDLTKPIEKLNFYPEFELPRKVVFHAIMGDYVREKLSDFKKSDKEFEYAALAKDIVGTYLADKESQELGTKLEKAEAALFHFVNNFAQAVSEWEAEDWGYKNFPQWLRLALLYAESFAVVPYTENIEAYLETLVYDEKRGFYNSEVLSDDSGRIDCYLNDLSRAELNDFFNFFGNPEPSRMLINESTMRGGDPSSKRSITTALSIKSFDRIPSKPREFYRSKFSKLFKVLNQIEPTEDDIIALDWCVKEWSALARDYLGKDDTKRYLAIKILEALITEFESGFWDAKMRKILATNPEVMRELRKDLNEVAKLYIPHMDLYDKKEYRILRQRFFHLEYSNCRGILIDLTPVVDAIDELTKKEKEE